MKIKVKYKAGVNGFLPCGNKNYIFSVYLNRMDNKSFLSIFSSLLIFLLMGVLMVSSAWIIMSICSTSENLLPLEPASPQRVL